MNFVSGASRIDCTPPFKGMCMMGFADPNHRVTGFAKPIHSRAVFIKDENSGNELFFVCLEVAYITESLRLETVSRAKASYPGLLKDESQLVLTATHTHSAPGGYSQEILYNLGSIGYAPEVFECYVTGILNSMVKAKVNQKEATLKFIKGEIPAHERVAFNRSIKAWNQNRDVKKYSESESHLAVNREMILLRIDAVSGAPIGFINWFSVHGTSMHKDSGLIHSDNKGVAATNCEEEISKETGSEFVAVFAQGAAGDISPNFRRWGLFSEMKGEFKEDLKSCDFNAEIQSRYSISLWKRAKNNLPLSVKLDSVFSYEKLDKMEVDAEFAPETNDRITTESKMGIRTFRGTREGTGVILPVYCLAYVVTIFPGLVRKFLSFFTIRETSSEATDKKVEVINMSRSRIFDVDEVHKVVVPDRMHPTLALAKLWSRKGIIQKQPLSPTLLPFQIVRLGEIAFAAVSSELTTTAGKRLSTSLLKQLEKYGIREIFITGYSNSYSGYVTTFEEYQIQLYEGASTHFGPLTLAAYQTLLSRLSSLFGVSPDQRPRKELSPPRLNQNDLKHLETPLTREPIPELATIKQEISSF